MGWWYVLNLDRHLGWFTSNCKAIAQNQLVAFIISNIPLKSKGKSKQITGMVIFSLLYLPG